MTVITSLRVVQDDGGEGFLMGCYAGSPCGCRIEGAGVCGDPLRIEYCPMHQAAKELLEALTNIEKWTRQYAETSRDCAGSRIPVTGYKERLLLAANTARAAIKAAGG